MANEKHILVTAQGDYTTGPLSGEIWEVGLRYVLRIGSLNDPIGVLPNEWNPGAATINRVETNWMIVGNWTIEQGVLGGFAVDDWLNDQVAPAFATWMAHNARANSCRLTQLRAYPIGTDGRAIAAPPYSAGSPILLQWTSSFPIGGSSAAILPLQNAVVCSHRTAQIGRRGRGRMFTPGPATTAMTINGRLDTGVRTTYLNKQKALLEDSAYINVVPPAELQIAIQPIITGGSFTDYAIINQVQVGDVIDTQRRRRNREIEDRASISVSY